MPGYKNACPSFSKSSIWPKTEVISMAWNYNPKKVCMYVLRTASLWYAILHVSDAKGQENFRTLGVSASEDVQIVKVAKKTHLHLFWGLKCHKQHHAAPQQWSGSRERIQNLEAAISGQVWARTGDSPLPPPKHPSDSEECRWRWQQLK